MSCITYQLTFTYYSKYLNLKRDFLKITFLKWDTIQDRNKSI